MGKNVKLISSDGKEFLVKEELAVQSETLKSFLNRDYPFLESRHRSIILPIKSNMMKRVIEYLEYKKTFSDAQSVIPDFNVLDEETQELLDISAYLKI
jgi:hypothetical protein